MAGLPSLDLLLQEVGGQLLELESPRKAGGVREQGGRVHAVPAVRDMQRQQVVLQRVAHQKGLAGHQTEEGHPDLIQSHRDRLQVLLRDTAESCFVVRYRFLAGALIKQVRQMDQSQLAASESPWV